MRVACAVIYKRARCVSHAMLLLLCDVEIYKRKGAWNVCVEVRAHRKGRRARKAGRRYACLGTKENEPQRRHVVTPIRASVRGGGGVCGAECMKARQQRRGR